ncbi:N-acyl-D-amino-acid deacylase family protein [Steroidobacter sp.]|uniref:N-acyl-D-amino-acid deacylase family protein n=1 Tax=Steroidobacter sp. TaxID=1978227 RepID=UPI001A45C42A|nr:D-aminoacylase [Steroidobacter sp.]MBL8268877.1 D-aminoacylase [Steroidobacter sp.]
MRKTLLFCSLLATTLFATAPARSAEQPLDVLIVNARIVDGGGNPWYRGSVGIRDGRIVSVAPGSVKTPSKRTIDAADRVVAPGFIDLMGQDTFVYLTDPDSARSRLYQGVTTHVSGEGGSHAPQNERTQRKPEMVNGKPVRWRTYKEYFQILESHGVPINVAHNVGAGQVRLVVMGEEDRAPTAAEMQEMKRVVAEAMDDGAFGLSTALIYPPGAYATTQEIVELAKVAASHGGFYSTHMRNESVGLLAAIDESIQIGELGGLPVHIYHLKAAGKRQWPLMNQAITRIDAARTRGLDVTSDIYPYIRNGIGLESFLPPSLYVNGFDAAKKQVAKAAKRRELRAELENPNTTWENWYQHVGADWSKVLLTDSGRYPRDVAGLSVADVAKKENRDVWEVFFELAMAQVNTAPESMDEAQKHAALRAPWVMIETDTPPVNIATAKSTHPRALGAFPRVLAKYVRDEHILTMEEATRRMTSMVANRMGLTDRGRIAPGMAADLVVFDPQRIQDQSTFEKPMQFSTGVDYLLINGKLSIDDGKATGVLAGQVLRHQQ